MVNPPYIEPCLHLNSPNGMKTNDTSKARVWWIRIRRSLAWLVGLYLAQMYVRYGWDKFDPEGFWAAPFERWGYPVWLRLVVGFIETAGGVLILVPWTATYAGVAVAAVMAGAFYTRFGSGFPEDLVWIAAYAVALLWIAFEWRSFRWPRFGRRFFRSEKSNGQ